MFRPKIPRAGSVRIGEPPDKGRNYPRKLDHFQFTLPVKEGKYYPRDPFMHEIYGAEPKYIGPLYLISDSLVDSMNIQLAWWGSGKLKSRRKCFKMLNPLGRGNVDDGLPASQLYKTPDGKGLAYRDRVCLSNECPDFGAGKCGGSLCFKFWLPNSPRLGEYWLTAGSYHALNAAFGFIEMMRRGLQEDPETGSLIGLSKIPLALVLKQDSVSHEGKDVVVYYPELSLDRKLIEMTREQGVFNALPTLAGNDGRNLLTAGKATRRFQKEEAEAAVYEGSASDIADDGESIEGYEMIGVTIINDFSETTPEEEHEAHASSYIHIAGHEPDDSEEPEPEPEIVPAKIVPEIKKASAEVVEEKEPEPKKVLDTTSDSEYNSKASDEDEMSEAEAELMEAELEAMAAVGEEPAVIEEAESETLALSILEEEEAAQASIPAPKTATAGNYILVSQVVSGGGTEKREEVLNSIPSDFEKLNDCNVWVSSGEDKNDVRFVFDAEDSKAVSVKTGFMNSPWAIGKLRFQLSKGIDNAVRRLEKFSS